MLNRFPFNNGHVQTILPALLRRGPAVRYARERIPTPDGDFLDLDWCGSGNSRVAVVLHGLEGSSSRSYVRGMVHALTRNGWDCAAMNFRGCSGEPNLKLGMYHSGLTEDLDTVVRHVLDKVAPDALGLVGFSMGGNQILKYLGEDPHRVSGRIVGACAISVPCDLEGAAHALARPVNSVYMEYFLKSLRRKIRQKAEMFPGALDTTGLDSVRTFAEFDDRYTAPMHGFAGALDYWRRCSSLRVLSDIASPALILNAADDPFLSPDCFPFAAARQNPFLTLEVPSTGGHCGFLSVPRDGLHFLERRVLAFLDSVESSPGTRETYE